MARSAALTRTRLLGAAGEELAASGGTLEVAAVARRAGTSHGLLYHHFDSKGGLLAALVETFYDELTTTVLDVAFPEPTWALRERRRIEGAVAYFYANPLSEVILNSLAREPAVVTTEKRCIDRQMQIGAHNIAAAQKSGDIPDDMDPEVLVSLIVGGMLLTVGKTLGRRPRPAESWLVEHLWRFVMDASRARS